MELKIKNAKYEWDPDTGTATCSCDYNNIKYTGIAHCHPEDQDMMNENTGMTIAEWRLQIQLLRVHREEVKTELKTLKQLYYSMTQSKNFNYNSYETKTLRRQIRERENYLDFIRNELIPPYQKYLRDWIDGKDKFYKRIRANRAKDKSE